MYKLRRKLGNCKKSDQEGSIFPLIGQNTTGGLGLWAVLCTPLLGLLAPPLPLLFSPHCLHSISAFVTLFYFSLDSSMTKICISFFENTTSNEKMGINFLTLDSLSTRRFLRLHKNRVLFLFVKNLF